MRAGGHLGEDAALLRVQDLDKKNEKQDKI